MLADVHPQLNAALTQGGSNPEWLAGSRLAYADGGQRLVSEIREAGGTLKAARIDTLNSFGARLAVDDRGERVLVARESGAWRIVVVKNWVQDARRKLRAR